MSKSLKSFLRHTFNWDFIRHFWYNFDRELKGLWPNVFLSTEMSGDIRIITCMSVTD